MKQQPSFLCPEGALAVHVGSSLICSLPSCRRATATCAASPAPRRSQLASPSRGPSGHAAPQQRAPAFPGLVWQDSVSLRGPSSSRGFHFRLVLIHVHTSTTASPADPPQRQAQRQTRGKSEQRLPQQLPQLRDI